MEIRHQPADHADLTRAPTRSRPPVPRREWLLLAGLLLLALVPSVAGTVRVGEIAAGVPETAQNARFLQMPWPVVLHIAGALVFSLIAPFQLLPTLRRRHLRWHRWAGRWLLLPSGMVVALTGLWMTAAYDVPAPDGIALEVSRYVVGIAMATSLVLAVRAIRRRDRITHGAWMLRAYALAMGAGTQVLTSGPALLLLGEPNVLMRVVQMDVGWLINVLIAEWVIARRRRRARR